MSSLSIRCTVPKPLVFPGESLEARLRLENGGDAPLEIVAPGSAEPPPIVLELQDDDGRVLYTLSRAGLHEDLAGEDWLPPMEPELLSLGPGEGVDFEEDIAELIPAGLEPGVYTLTVRYEGFGASKPVRVEVVTPRVDHLARLLCPQQRKIATAFDHAGDDEVLLLSREPFSEAPENGVFYRWLAFPQTAGLGALALAAHTAPRLEGRWLAWLQGQYLGAARPWGNVLTDQVSPTYIGLERPLLAEPGFQLDDGSALFLAAGGVRGGAGVTRLSCSAGVAAAGPVVPLCDRAPKRLLARYAPEEGGRLTLVWAEERRRGVKIWMRRYGGDGQPEDPAPELLLERPAPLQALELWPLGGAEGGFVHALIGPEGDEGWMSYVRLPLQQSDQLFEEWQILAPEGQVDDWAIASTAAGALPVVARVSDKLLLCRARAPRQWELLSDGLAGASFLHLLGAEDHGLWVGLCDALLGPIYLALE